MTYMAKAPQAKVHVMVNGRPLCGGGNGAKSWKAWQADMGPANCGACLAISGKRSAKAAREASE